MGGVGGVLGRFGTFLNNVLGIFVMFWDVLGRFETVLDVLGLFKGDVFGDLEKKMFWDILGCFRCLWYMGDKIKKTLQIWLN